MIINKYIKNLAFVLVALALVFVLPSLALATTVSTDTSEYLNTQSMSTLCDAAFPGNHTAKVIFPTPGLVGHKEPHQATVSASIPAGTYNITVATLDSYKDRVSVAQSNEQLFLSLSETNGQTVETGLTTDLPDYAVTGWSIDAFNNIVLAASVNSVTAKHVVYTGVTGPNSVQPVCAVFDLKSDPVVNPDPELSGSCSANPSSVLVGNSVSWTANVSGGNGNYEYLWSGTDALSGNTKNVSKVYSNVGTKEASVTIKSGSKTITRTCSANVTQNQTNNFTVSCHAEDTSVDVGDYVNWVSNVSGANGTIYYSWTGTDGLYGNSSSISRTYNNDGNKNAYITVTTSTGQSQSASCSANVKDNNNDYLDVSCYASPSNPQVGERVRWYAEADGGDGDYDYDWSGTDGLDSSSRSPSMTYDYSGTKTARVRVTSDGQTETANCRVNVYGQNSVLAFSQSNQTPLESVYLSQVPYTGFGDNKASVWFTLGLALFSAYVAYVVIANKNKNKENA